jgi:hypothetical protein
MRDIKSVSPRVVDSAMKCARRWGEGRPGLLESADEGCLLHELRKRGLKRMVSKLEPSASLRSLRGQTDD